MIHEILLAGAGGQGILFLGRILAEAALMENKEVSWFPAYGPEQRGGTSHCSVVISQHMIGNPMVSEPDILVAMNYASRQRFLGAVKGSGIVITNDVVGNNEGDDRPGKPMEIVVPANEIGEELGQPRVANIVMLGTLLANRPVVKRSTVEQILSHVLRSGREEMLTMNRKALERGYAYRSP